MTIGWKDGIDTAKFDGRLIQIERDQRTRADIVGNDKRRQICKSLTGDGCGSQGFAIVRPQISNNVSSDVSLCAEDPLINAGHTGERVSKTIVLGQI